jgi:hypothetical protein
VAVRCSGGLLNERVVTGKERRKRKKKIRLVKRMGWFAVVCGLLCMGKEKTDLRVGRGRGIYAPKEVVVLLLTNSEQSMVYLGRQHCLRTYSSCSPWPMR